MEVCKYCGSVIKTDKSKDKKPVVSSTIIASDLAQEIAENLKGNVEYDDIKSYEHILKSLPGDATVSDFADVVEEIFGDADVVYDAINESTTLSPDDPLSHAKYEIIDRIRSVLDMLSDPNEKDLSYDDDNYDGELDEPYDEDEEREITKDWDWR